MSKKNAKSSNVYDEKNFSEDFYLLKYRYHIDTALDLSEFYNLLKEKPSENDILISTCLIDSIKKASIESIFLCQNYWIEQLYWGYSKDEKYNNFIYKYDIHSRYGAYTIDLFLLQINAMFNLYLSLFHYFNSEFEPRINDMYSLYPNHSIFTLSKELSSYSSYQEFKNEKLIQLIKSNNCPYSKDTKKRFTKILTKDTTADNTKAPTIDFDEYNNMLMDYKKNMSSIVTNRRATIKNSNLGKQLFSYLTNNNSKSTTSSCLYAPLVNELIKCSNIFSHIDNIFDNKTTFNEKSKKDFMNKMFKPMATSYNNHSYKNTFENAIMHFLYNKYFHVKYSIEADNVIKQLALQSISSSYTNKYIATYSDLCIGSNYMLEYPLNLINNKVINTQYTFYTQEENMRNWHTKYEHHLKYNKFGLYPLIYSCFKHRLYHEIKEKYPTENNHNAVLKNIYKELGTHLKKYAHIYLSFDWLSFYKNTFSKEQDNIFQSIFNTSDIKNLYSLANNISQLFKLWDGSDNNKYAYKYDSIDATNLTHDNAQYLIELYSYWLSPENIQKIYTSSSTDIFNNFNTAVTSTSSNYTDYFNSLKQDIIRHISV